MNLCLADTEQDRISCLPDHIIGDILSKLPIREAVRTSVLSGKWRYKWTTLPNLYFLDERDSGTSHRPLVSSEIIDHVFLLHLGPIKKFVLRSYHLIGAKHIDRWTHHLIGRSIEKLVLKIKEGPCYKIPQRLFSCQSLRYLQLNNCWLKPPSTFEDLTNLKCLVLKCVTIAQGDFEKLISNCPLLEAMKLTDLDGITEFNIHAPNLKIFELMGIFDDISFVNTFQLTLVIVDLCSKSDTNENTLYGCSSNLLKFFAHLSYTKQLYIEGDFLKYLVSDVKLVPVKFPLSCISLSFLRIEINFNDVKEISAALCVFRSSPNLRELDIYARPSKETVASYCTEDIFYDWPAMQVWRVSLYDISGIKSEFDFIRFVLLYSPVLQRMTIEPASNVGLDSAKKLLKEIVKFKRTSGEAEVIYIDPA